MVYNMVTAKWTEVICSGEAPEPSRCYTCQIIAKKMYAINVRKHRVFILDLTLLHWTALIFIPKVPRLLYKCNFGPTSSFLWQDKFYIFGGMGEVSTTLSKKQDQISLLEYHMPFLFGPCQYNNQCVAFNTTTSSWEWPRFKGDPIPSPRVGHGCILSEDYMLLFGGERNFEFFNDLNALHIPSHTWSKLQDNTKDKVADKPCGRKQFSFTLVGKNRAILYGGTTGREDLADCWLLTWSIKEAEITDIHWSLLRNANKYQHRSTNHQVHYSPETSKLYLFGGASSSQHSEAIPMFLAAPSSLFQASLNIFAKNEEHILMA